MAKSKWYSGSVRVMIGPRVDPQSVELSADYHLDVPGLAVNKYPFQRRWMVTHAPSSLLVVSDIKSRSEARRVLEDLGRLAVACGGTWNLPFEELVKSRCLFAQAAAFVIKLRTAASGLVGRTYGG